MWPIKDTLYIRMKYFRKSMRKNGIKKVRIDLGNNGRHEEMITIIEDLK